MHELSIILTIAGGGILVTYRQYAAAAGLPIGEMFNKDWPILVGGISSLGAVFAAFMSFGLIWASGYLIGGYALAFAITFILRSWAPLIAILMIVAGNGLLFLL